VSERRFIVFFKDGSTQPITAEYGDQDDEAMGMSFSWARPAGSPGYSLKTSFSRGAKTLTATETRVGRRCCGALAYRGRSLNSEDSRSAPAFLLCQNNVRTPSVPSDELAL
jgi:hypothetical protein